MNPTDEIRELEPLGAGKKKKPFSYKGSVRTGVVLQQSGKPKIDARFFLEALYHFSGRTVYGGFREDAAPRDSFGKWIEQSSPRFNSRKLTPRHGSFMAAILCNESGVRHSRKGNKIVLSFPTIRGT